VRLALHYPAPCMTASVTGFGRRPSARVAPVANDLHLVRDAAELDPDGQILLDALIAGATPGLLAASPRHSKD
jgi:hypothetical protein